MGSDWKPRTEYAKKLELPAWQKKRLEILNRDDFRCQVCGRRDRQLHVHHAWYSPGEPWDAPNNSLYTCCADCHGPEHDLHGEWSRLMLCLFAAIGIRSSTDFSGFAVAYQEVSKDGISREAALGIVLSTFGEYKAKSANDWFEEYANK